jgi:hypothetical protein
MAVRLTADPILPISRKAIPLNGAMTAAMVPRISQPVRSFQSVTGKPERRAGLSQGVDREEMANSWLGGLAGICSQSLNSSRL